MWILLCWNRISFTFLCCYVADVSALAVTIFTVVGFLLYSENIFLYHMNRTCSMVFMRRNAILYAVIFDHTVNSTLFSLFSSLFFLVDWVSSKGIDLLVSCLFAGVVVVVFLLDVTQNLTICIDMCYNPCSKFLTL